MTSWQAALCPTGKVFGYTELGEPDTRARLTSDGSSGLAFTTRALGADTGTTAPTDSTVYAPTALSGTVIGFTIERRPKAGASDATRRLAGTKVESIDLTPRLVAKLLTESYRNSPGERSSAPPSPRATAGRRTTRRAWRATPSSSRSTPSSRTCRSPRPRPPTPTC